MSDPVINEAQKLVADVRAAATAHKATWEELVPSTFVVNFDAERAEEDAYAEMAAAKAALRQHICDTYGLTIREICSLANP
jgi:hypothetical protein